MGDNSNKGNFLNSTMSLGDHLEELRARLILAIVGLLLGMVISLVFGQHLIRIIEMPYNNLKDEYGLGNLMVLAPADAFAVYMKVSFVAGLILSSPWFFYQLWMFIAAGLYEHEKRYVRTAVPFLVVLFVGGTAFFIFGLAPLILTFFVKFSKFIGVESAWTLEGYISFMANLTLVFGLAFQTPIIIFTLNKTGLVSLRLLYQSRKYVFLGVFIVAAIVTPGDAIPQIALAIPLYLLFEFGVLLSYFTRQKP